METSVCVTAFLVFASVVHKNKIAFLMQRSYNALPYFFLDSVDSYEDDTPYKDYPKYCL